MNPKALSVLIPMVITLGILASVEIGARILMGHQPTAVHPVVPNELFNHIWTPSMKAVDSFRSVPYTITTNRQGWLEEYAVPEKKPAHTFRIFYVGDSTTQGVVDTEKKMCKIVGRRLNDLYRSRGIHVEVINTGTPSWATSQYYLLSTKILPMFSPDLVVINVDMTDVPDDHFYRSMSRFDANGTLIAVQSSIDATRRYHLTPYGAIEKNKIEKISDGLARTSKFFAWLKNLSFLRKNNATLGRDPLETGPANWLAQTWTPEIESSVQYSMDNISKTIRFLRSKGIRVLITGVPHYSQFMGQDSVRPHEVLEKTVTASGGLFLNSYESLKSRIKGSAQTDYYWSNDPGHFNEKGNAAWADVQFDFLMAHREVLLP